MNICRSQIDVQVAGNCAALLQEMKGFHWMMSYRNYLKESGYALRKLGVEFHDVSQSHRWQHPALSHERRPRRGRPTGRNAVGRWKAIEC